MAVLLVLLALAISGFTHPAAADELYGTLKKIKESGTIIIGHNADSPPFSFIGPTSIVRPRPTR
jgi:ABC-type amino acid transport substrate-binding protein